ncbi:MAG: hypothetical protein ACOCSE_00895, partial [Chitinivibrionales bacterium]
MIETKFISYVFILTVIISTPLKTIGFELDKTSLETSFRFDRIATHGFEVESETQFRINQSFSLIAAAKYLDAVQDSISGIRQLHGRIASGIIGFEWMMPKSIAVLKVHGGFDWITDWEIKPRGMLNLKLSPPIPPNPVIQNPSLTLNTWYDHEFFNGPAVKNRIASYGYSSDLEWITILGINAALSFKQEFLEPDNKLLDSTFTASTDKGYPVDTDTLPLNSKKTFYAYMYRKFGKFLYLGYAFSYTHTDHDRKVITDAELHEPGPDIDPGGPGGSENNRYYSFSWAYYPYPTPRYMLAHSITAACVFRIKKRIQIKLDIAFPFYSRQEMKTVLNYYEPNWGIMDNAYDRNEYGEHTEKFTGPLTINSEIGINFPSETTLSAVYS